MTKYADFIILNYMDKVNIIETFKKANLKVTPQRTAIINVILNYGHIDIEQLIHKLSKLMPSLSVATIYKNIITLLEYKIIKEVLLPNKKKMFELNYNTHLHVICKRCGKITDINVGTEIIKERFSGIVDVEIEDFLFNLFYLCDDCKNEQQ